MSRLQSTLRLISTPSSTAYESTNFRFPVTWKRLSRFEEAERWEMVVPRMVRPARLSPGYSADPELLGNLRPSESIFLRLWQWAVGLWHGSQSNSRW